MKKKLHIISFNVPAPPDYGGVIDVYYKIKALAEQGVDIILHCFQYGRDKSDELERICNKVYYYKRKKGIPHLFSTKPYIVKTRKSKDLLKNLQNEMAPILFEGLHTCFYIDSPALGAHAKIVRAHNVEHEYYHFLSLSETNPYKKFYFKLEASKLKLFEKRLILADRILSISEEDYQYFSSKYLQTINIPAFHPFESVTSKTGIGDYVLYHGNLSVQENQEAVNYLLANIFSEITVPFVIAGKNPPEWLKNKVNVTPHITLFENPDNEVMSELIHDAQIHLLPTFQPTGFKLKLLTSLFSGRHCITNLPMVKNTGLESLCDVAKNDEEMIRLILNKFEEPFTHAKIWEREQILKTSFSNSENAKKIIDLI